MTAPAHDARARRELEFEGRAAVVVGVAAAALLAGFVVPAAQGPDATVAAARVTAAAQELAAALHSTHQNQKARSGW